MPCHTQILRNRLVLVTEPVVTAKTVAIGFWFSVGSRMEPANLRGISHFTEHLLFKGTKKRSSYDISVSFDRIGGYANAFTERECICMHCTVPSKYALDALEILCDMTQNAVFDSKEIVRERSVIESEIISSQDDPEEAALDALSGAVWNIEGLKEPISGTVENVRNIKDEQLLSWYKEHIVNGPLEICIAGNFNEDDAANLIEKLIPNHNEHKNLLPLNDKKVWNQGLHILNTNEFSQTQIFLLHRFDYPISQKEYYAFSILNAMAGDTMSSRLFQELREKNGWCYSVYSYFTFYEDTAYWCAYASCDKKNLVSVVTKLLLSIKDFSSGNFTEDEIIAAKEHVSGEELISCEDMEYRMKKLDRNQCWGFSFLDAEETSSYIHTINFEELVLCAEKIFSGQNALVLYGPRISSSVKQKLKEAYSEYC